MADPSGKPRSKPVSAGRAVLLADAEEACAYREQVKRVTKWWNPDNVEEHALVQALADTQWRLEAVPGLESALYARARRRGEPLLTHPDPTAQRLLLDAQAEIAEARALKNLRLHKRRLRRQFDKDKAELNELRNARLEQEGEEQQRRQERARLRRERKQMQEQTAPADTESETVLPNTNGFEFADFASLDHQHPCREVENVETRSGGPIKR